MVNIDAEWTTTIAKSNVLDVVGSGCARLSTAAVHLFANDGDQDVLDEEGL